MVISKVFCHQPLKVFWKTFIIETRFCPIWMSWNVIEQVSSPAVSWCRFEAFVSKPENVSVTESTKLTPPPLVVLALSLRTAPHPRTHQNEITAAACLVHRCFHLDCSAPKPVFQSHFCAVASPAECVFPFDFRDRVTGRSSSQVSMKVEMMSSERALVNFILAKLLKVFTCS